MTDSVKELIERHARAIYEHGDFGKLIPGYESKPHWQDRGNSDAQELARSMARTSTLKALAESEAALRERVGELEGALCDAAELEAMCRQAFGMAREGSTAPNAAYRWCERIEEVFHLGPQSEYNEFARPLPARKALEAKS